MPRGWKWGKKRKSGYRSGAEETLAAWLTEHGIDFSYESIKLLYEKPVRGAICKTCDGKTVVKKATYLPDFTIKNKNNKDDDWYIEYKGRLTASDRAKYVSVKRSNPKCKLRFVFGSNNLLRKGSLDRCSDWAESVGFDYSIKAPNLDWFKG